MAGLADNVCQSVARRVVAPVAFDTVVAAEEVVAQGINSGSTAAAPRHGTLGDGMTEAKLAGDMELRVRETLGGTRR
jgi:hypothetical protein